jgi:hypothetical protein
MLDIVGAFSMRTATLTLSNTTNDNVVHPAASFLTVAGPTAAFNLSGLTLGTDGRWTIIHNNVAQDMTIEDEEADNTAANRFTTGTGADVTLTGISCWSMIYSSVTSRWILVSTLG